MLMMMVIVQEQEQDITNTLQMCSTTCTMKFIFIYFNSVQNVYVYVVLCSICHFFRAINAIESLGDLVFGVSRGENYL